MLDIVIQEKYREAAEAPAAVAEPSDTAAVVVESVESAASTAMEFPPAKGFLSLFCKRCTRLNQFISETQAAAQLQAKAAGWKMTKYGAVCKRCPC